MIAVCNVKQIYEYRCSICGKTIKQEVEIPRFGQLMRPAIPELWRAIEYQLICDEHDITVLIGDEEIGP